MSENLNFFVLRFYYYFLETDAGKLFDKTKFEKQYKMFYASIELIITHINNPDLIEDYLNDLVNAHKTYGVVVEHVDFFIGSFMKALQEIYIGANKKEIIDIWYKIIIKIMAIFERKLRTI